MKENYMSVHDDLKQLSSRNPKGMGAKSTRAVAIDTDMAVAARTIAEKNRVTINSVVSYAILRLTQEIERGLPMQAQGDSTFTGFSERAA
jgi:hypothetical protein